MIALISSYVRIQDLNHLSYKKPRSQTEEITSINQGRKRKKNQKGSKRKASGPETGSGSSALGGTSHLYHAWAVAQRAEESETSCTTGK